jgi:hypothetical protein
MRRVLVLALATAAVAAVPAGAAQSPSLTLLRVAPLVVKGSAFTPRSTVTVSAPYGRLHVRTTTRGVFVASFPGNVDRCSNGGTVVAVGVGGEKVTLRLPKTLCAPAGAA